MKNFLSKLHYNIYHSHFNLLGRILIILSIVILDIFFHNFISNIYDEDANKVVGFILSSIIFLLGSISILLVMLLTLTAILAMIRWLFTGYFDFNDSEEDIRNICLYILCIPFGSWWSEKWIK